MPSSGTPSRTPARAAATLTGAVLVGCLLAPSAGAAPSSDGPDPDRRGPTSLEFDGRADPHAPDKAGANLSASKVARVAGRYEMPFPCGEYWTGSTRGGHSPSSYSVDWNRPDDVDDLVVASAPGTVVVANNTSRRGYGHYVVIEHAGGERTVYAHLNSVVTSVGAYVDQGAAIGTVGSTGNSTGPHLHYEQRTTGGVSPAYLSGAAFQYGSTARSANCVDSPLAGNLAGDAVSELAFFRRDGRFYLQMPDGSQQVMAFGFPTDTPFLADFTGDGYAEIGVRRPENSTWYVYTPGGTLEIPFGLPTDRPVVGDWNGDGLAQPGVFRPSERRFYLRAPDGSWTSLRLGSRGSTPVAGDWNGDGIDDVGVFKPRSGMWKLRVVNGGSAWGAKVQYANPGDLPLVGDWDGNGISDLGLWRPTEGQAYKRIAGSPQMRPVKIAAEPLGRARNGR